MSRQGGLLRKYKYVKLGGIWNIKELIILFNTKNIRYYLDITSMPQMYASGDIKSGEWEVQSNCIPREIIAIENGVI